MKSSAVLGILIVGAAAAGAYWYSNKNGGAPSEASVTGSAPRAVIESDPNAIDPFPIDGRAHITAFTVTPSAPKRGAAVRVSLIVQNTTAKKASGCRVSYRIGRKADGGAASPSARKGVIGRAFALAPGEEREIKASVGSGAMGQAGEYALRVAAGCRSGAAASAVKFLTAR